MNSGGPKSADEPAPSAVFRLPRTAYLIVLLLAFGVVPIAFTASGFGYDDKGGVIGPPADVGWQTAVLIVPVLAAVFIARWATFVDDEGIRVRAAFGSRSLPWDGIRGLMVEDRSVFAVLGDGAVRLPCVHVNQLWQLTRASGGRLPAVASPYLRTPPTKGRRRR